MSQGLDILQYFKYAHLPKDLQVVSKPFSDMAQVIATLPGNPERTVSLRKLLESKDAAVRAAMAVERSEVQQQDSAVVPFRPSSKEALETRNGEVWGNKESMRSAARSEEGFYGRLSDKDESITPVRFFAYTLAGVTSDALDFANQWSGYNRLMVTFCDGKIREADIYELVNGAWSQLPPKPAQMSVNDVMLNGDAG